MRTLITIRWKRVVKSLKHLCKRHSYLAYRLKRAGQILERDIKTNHTKAMKAWMKESHTIQAKMLELHGETKRFLSATETLHPLSAADSESSDSE